MCSAPLRKNALNLLLKVPQKTPVRSVSTYSRGTKAALASVTAVGAGIAGTVIALHRSVYATELELHPPTYPWYHSGAFKSFDHKSLRRGYEVYRQVCAACHSMRYIAFRHLVGVTHTEEEAKALAEEFQVEDGPNDEGNYYTRPGKLSDYFPKPYKNDEAGKAANNGVLPPDLSLMISARHGHEDYVYSILTGYSDPPAGVTLGEGQHFNAYFPGQVIGMTEPLYDEIIEYEDGTPATKSQLAKDVTTFLKWTAEPYYERRKVVTLKILMWLMIMAPASFYLARRTWMPVKLMELAHKPVSSLKPNLKRKVAQPIEKLKG